MAEKYKILETGIEFERGLPFEEWEKLGETLFSVHEGMGFRLGDWLRFGIAEYGEMYSQALEVTGLTKDALMHMKSVAAHVAPENRVAKLSFSHHRTVAYLEPAEQKKM